MKRILTALVFCFCIAISSKAQLATATCNVHFENPAQEWILEKVEYYQDVTRCHFCVKSKIDGISFNMVPGVHMTDYKGHTYEYKGCSNNVENSYKFKSSNESISIYMDFEPMKKYAWKCSIVLPDFKTIDNIPVGDGTTITHTFEGNGRPKAQKANLWITKIERFDNRTVVEFLYDNSKPSSSGFYDWARIDQNSVLLVDGHKYPMLVGESKSFTFNKRTTRTFSCAFPRIPKDASSLSFIESPTSSFNITGITFKNADPDPASSQYEVNASQAASKRIDEDKVYSVEDVDEKPTFPGGSEAMHAWLKSHIITKYVKKSKGTVKFSFIVEKTGTLSNVKIEHGLDKSADKEVLRVVKSMPTWYPGKISNEPVQTCVTGYFTF